MRLKHFTLFKSVVAPLVILLVGCSHVTTDTHITPKVRFELRLVQYAPSENCQEMEVYGAKHKVYVEQDICFSNSDIKHAKAEMEKGTVMKDPIIILKLTSDGSERFAKFTKDNYNKSVAIIFDGKVMATPIIRDTITSGIIYFTGRFTLEEAKVFAKRINGY